MPEERTKIKNGSLMIEGLFHRFSGTKGLVICHPHSLMGGSMYNNVVETIQETFATEEISTMRFNFRGVGGSTGSYDEGRGEQQDILAVCEYLKKSGLTELLFAGYSFGAWVGSKVLEDQNILFSTSIFVAPPISYFDFEWEKLKGRVDLIICGERDPFCSLNVLTREAKKINVPLEIIRGGDHFYMGRENELAEILKKFIVKKNIIKL